MPEIDTNWLPNNLPGFAEKHANELVSVTQHRGDTTLVIRPVAVLPVLAELKAAGFEVMMDLFGMDYLKFEPEMPERYAVIYNLYSVSRGLRVFVKVYLSEESPEVESAIGIWPAANWFEREAWDLFGIQFKGHPNLQRILCHHDFEGHPLRKDYPADQYQRLKTAAPSSGF